eukprot:TRINITY_DN722_c1_g1_i1.p1 TRINITY_DN722_c1_g1~~TRINITY_DN722_c1_g1_i1.p1  ORF type:complete len:633 (+),score=130.55 TRINITY_DN722_c1_g1_i1:226-1899(+)
MSVCTVCEIVVDAIGAILQSKPSVDMFEKLFAKICISLKIEAKEVCDGIVHEFAPEILEIAARIGIANVCPIIGLCPRDGEEGEDMPPMMLTDFDVPSPRPGPPVPLPKRGEGLGDIAHVVHITDIHIDLQYKVNTRVDCGLPMCCRESDGPGTANKWGEFTCDTPVTLFEGLLDHLSTLDPAPEYLAFTGDSPPHDVWKQSREENLAANRAIISGLGRALPHTRILPTFGNHEAFPIDQYNIDPARMAWLYDATAEMWKEWLTEEALASVRHGGFYTMLLEPGLRVVSINTQYCDYINFWLLLNMTDPLNQLQWLSQVLYDAEAAGERVLLLGHIPMGSGDCLIHYNNKYWALLDRFRHVITNQLFGHTHNDEFRIYSDMATASEPILVSYTGPSFTPLTNHNPSYRIYKLDRNTMTFADWDHMYAELEEAQKHDRLTFKLEYSPLQAYGMTSLSPAEWKRFTDRMKTDDALAQLYHQHRHTMHTGTCSESCKKAEYCAATSSTNLYYRRCMGSTKFQERQRCGLLTGAHMQGCECVCMCVCVCVCVQPHESCVIV